MTRRLIVILLATVTALVLFACSGSARSATTYFRDDFNGTSLDSSAWCPSWWYSLNPQSPLQCDNIQATNSSAAADPAQVSEGDNHLTMGIIDDPWTDPSTGTTYEYRGSAINGNNKQSYGTVLTYAARIYLPCDASGQIENWPAFWFSTTSNADEIDVMEGLHGQAAWHYHFSKPDGTTGSIGSDIDAPGNWCGWHTFSVYRGNEIMTFRYDGNVVGTIQNGDPALDGVPLSTLPMFPRFDYLTADGIGGPIVTPAAMKVDWFQVTGP